MTEEPVLIANYTEGNIAYATVSFHYVKNQLKARENTIIFAPSPQDLVSGIVLVRMFFIDGQNTKNPMMAISNWVSLRMDF